MRERQRKKKTIEKKKEEFYESSGMSVTEMKRVRKIDQATEKIYGEIERGPRAGKNDPDKVVQIQQEV